MTDDFTRPYLVIPKLIKQPTWGGDYIVKFKNWLDKPSIGSLKIGQSYELFNGSNLSLLTSSQDPHFTGELTDAIAVENATKPQHSLSLARLITVNPQGTLGSDSLARFGQKMFLLIKFTQALGNSFQLHIKDLPAGRQVVQNKKWKTKPESWYYFEPGYITLGVKSGVDWDKYKQSVTQLNDQIIALGKKVASNQVSYEKVQTQIKKLVTETNPWMFVNLIHTPKEQLIDLSPCGIHHSWEEDTRRFPLGNVVYELQLDVLDHDSTIRNFDKGKMAADGSTRPLQIDEYFQFIDRSESANDPHTHMKSTLPITDNDNYTLNRLMHTKYYTLDKVELLTEYAAYTEKIDHFRHIFVKAGEIEVATDTHTITVSQGHSCFIPAAAKEYSIKNDIDTSTVLISY